MSDDQPPEEWHAKMDCLAADLLSFKYAMEDRNAHADEIAKLDAAFAVIVSEARRNSVLLPKDYFKEAE